MFCVQLSLLKHLQSCSGNCYKTKSSQARPSITVPLVETLHVAVDGKYLRIVSFAFSVGQILKAFTTLVSSTSIFFFLISFHLKYKSLETFCTLNFSPQRKTEKTVIAGINTDRVANLFRNFQ